MAGTSSISGLASGLDTATIISQLMQLEAVPQNRLKTRVGTEQSAITALQTVNTKAALLGSAAEALATPAKWSPLTTQSSNKDVSVSAGPKAEATGLTVTVTGVARTHQLGFAGARALSDVVTGASTTVRLDRFDGSPITVDSGDGTLKGLVSAINDPDNATGLRATTVKVAEGSYRLLVESVSTGVAQDFELTAADGTPLLGGATVRAGSDASIDLGAGITVTSATNTFTEVTPGVTLTLGPEATVGDVATISVARDTSAVTASVKSFVESLNAVLAEVDKQTAYDAATGTAGRLVGDAGLRNLRSALGEALYPTDGTSLADLGIEVDRYGKVTFDETAFKAAYAADPAGVAVRFTGSTDGLATKLGAVADRASDPATGTVTASIKGRKSGIDRLNDSIDAWDQRLELRKETLTRQFTALERAMSQMSGQANWLSGQLSSLPSWGS